jgi:hypothetical protein
MQHLGYLGKGGLQDRITIKQMLPTNNEQDESEVENTIDSGLDDGELSYELEDRSSSPGRGKRFFYLRHHVQTGSGAHLASYQMNTCGYITRG